LYGLTVRGQTEVLRENPVPLPFLPTQVSYSLPWI